MAFLMGGDSNYLTTYDTWKINMEPENDGLVQMIFLFNSVIFRFQPLFFRGSVDTWRVHPTSKLGSPGQVRGCMGTGSQAASGKR